MMNALLGEAERELHRVAAFEITRAFGVRQSSGALAGAERRGGDNGDSESQDSPATAPPPSAKRQRTGALQDAAARYESLRF